MVERQRAWLQGLLRGLVEEAGLHPVDGVAGALLLYEGAATASLLDHSPQPGRHARWAAEVILNTAKAVQVLYVPSWFSRNYRFGLAPRPASTVASRRPVS